MRPGKKELLNNPFSLQLFNCTPQDWSMCIFSQLFVQPHSEPRDKTAKVQQKLGPAENALAVRTCISHPLEFCHTASTLTYTSSLAQAKQLYFTKCQTKVFPQFLLFSWQPFNCTPCTEVLYLPSHIYVPSHFTLSHIPFKYLAAAPIKKALDRKASVALCLTLTT